MRYHVQKKRKTKERRSIMRKKTAAVFTAMLMTVFAASACGNNTASGNTKSSDRPVISPEAMEIADKYFSGDSDSFTAWNGIDRNKVVAYIEGSEDSDFFDITFDEFFSEYMYYLVSYQIDDDMSEDNKSACESYRDNIITYLTFERQYLYVGKNEYGITADTLTDAQRKEIDDSAEQVRSDWSSNFYTTVSTTLGDGAAEEEITAMCDEVLTAILQKCGLTEDIFHKWEQNRYLEELVIAEIVKDAVVTDKDVDEMYASLIEEARQCAETDPATYESLPSYSMVYIPDNTRVSEHILLPFSNEDIRSIHEAKEQGDTAKITELIEKAYTDEISQKAGEISGRLSEGADFSELRSEYDSEESGKYVVLKNSVTFPAAYVEALYSLADAGDVSQAVVTENGVYFVKYSEEASVKEEDTEEIREYLRSALDSNAETAAQNTAYSEWLEKYHYTIDYETLKIDQSGSILSSMSPAVG